MAGQDKEPSVQPLAVGRLAPHIQIVERVVYRESGAFESTDRLRHLGIGHIASRVILTVDAKDAGMLTSVLLPRLVHCEEVADIGG